MLTRHLDAGILVSGLIIGGKTMDIEQLKQRYIKALVEEAEYVDKIKKVEQEYFDNIVGMKLNKCVWKHPVNIEKMYRTKSTKYTREVKIAEKLLVRAFLKSAVEEKV